MAVEKSSPQTAGRKRITRQHFSALKAPLYTIMLVLVAVAAFGFVYIAYHDTVVAKVMFGVGPFEIIFTGIAMITLYKIYHRL